MQDHGELTARMAKHTPGQITWPSLTLNQTCDACRHFDTGAERLISGACGLVAAHQSTNTKPTKGKPYKGNEAKACPQFEQGTHWKREKQ